MKTTAPNRLFPAIAGTLVILAISFTPSHATRLGGNGVAMHSDAITSGGAVSNEFQVSILDPVTETSESYNFQITALVGDIAEAITVQRDGTGIGVDPDWLASHGITTFEPLSDDDKDGIPDIFEAVYNFNPHAPDAQKPYENGIHRQGGKDYLKIRFRRNTDNTGIVVKVERGTELAPSNFAATGVVEVLPRTPIDANTEWITFRSTTPIGATREFLRLKAEYTGLE